MKIPDDMNLTQAQAENICKEMSRLTLAIHRVIDDEDHKRIIHLARRAKKRRTRTKNLRRAGRYIWKEFVNA